MATIVHGAAITQPVPAAETSDTVLDGAAAGFGFSAVVAIFFNTILAWVKDAYDPLNTFMASLTGHHWWTHGLFDLALFVVLGVILTASGFRIDGTKLAVYLAGSVIIAGAGLALWFVLV